MDTKIRKEFYLLVYFVIFGGGEGILMSMHVYCVFMEVRRYIALAFAVEEDNRRGAKWMCPYKYMGGYEAKSPTFF